MRFLQSYKPPARLPSAAAISMVATQWGGRRHSLNVLGSFCFLPAFDAQHRQTHARSRLVERSRPGRFGPGEWVCPLRTWGQSSCPAAANTRHTHGTWEDIEGHTMHYRRHAQPSGQQPDCGSHAPAAARVVQRSGGDFPCLSLCGSRRGTKRGRWPAVSCGPHHIDMDRSAPQDDGKDDWRRRFRYSSRMFHSETSCVGDNAGFHVVRWSGIVGAVEALSLPPPLRADFRQ